MILMLNCETCFMGPHNAGGKFNENLTLSNSSGLKSVFEKLRFRDGLVCVFKFLLCSVDSV